MELMTERPFRVRVHFLCIERGLDSVRCSLFPPFNNADPHFDRGWIAWNFRVSFYWNNNLNLFLFFLFDSHKGLKYEIFIPKPRFSIWMRWWAVPVQSEIIRSARIDRSTYEVFGNRSGKKATDRNAPRCPNSQCELIHELRKMGSWAILHSPGNLHRSFSKASAVNLPWNLNMLSSESVDLLMSKLSN